jgi:hypothetical protein
MPQLPEEWRDPEVLGFFNRHLVPVYFEVVLGDVRRPRVWTAFVFSVKNRWLLITAGHCITEVQREREAGCKIVSCKLLDGLNSQAPHELPIPFDYDDFRPTMLGAHHTFDYGVLIPTSNAIALLKTNHIVPFAEASWDHEITDFDVYKFLGVPSALSRFLGAGNWNITTLFQRVRRLKRRPTGFEKTDAPMFYGRMMGDPRVKLQGMSGGPILGFVNDSGRHRYWLVGMQVSALRGRYISGMLMRPLGRLIYEIDARRQRA